MAEKGIMCSDEAGIFIYMYVLNLRSNRTRCRVFSLSLMSINPLNFENASQLKSLMQLSCLQSMGLARVR